MDELVIRMPKLSESMTDGKVLHWSVKPGDFVNVGEIIGEVETDKANMELEATVPGYVAEIFVQPGDVAPVGAALMRLTNNLDEVACLEPSWARSERSGSPSAGRQVPAGGADTDVKNGVGQIPGSKVPDNVSPVARELAEKLGVDLDGVLGSGPGGRITKNDVLRLQVEQLQCTSGSIPLSPNDDTIKLSEIGVAAENGGSKNKGALLPGDVTYPVQVKCFTLVGTVSAAPLLGTVDRVIEKMRLRPRIHPEGLIPLFIGRAFALAFCSVPAEVADSLPPASVAGCVAFGMTAMGRRLYPVIHDVASLPFSKLLIDYLDQRDRALSGSLRSEECLGAQFIVEMLNLPKGAIAGMELDEGSTPLILVNNCRSEEFQIALAVRSSFHHLTTWAELHALACEMVEYPLLLAERFASAYPEG
ncbi:MAG: E3 binding domain-containing protein [Candidatus Sumerlaeaceae bacterium]|nr:E3 binding domain-containing protein [Candidatus Sumerlaeaceae bacterium]